MDLPQFSIQDLMSWTLNVVRIKFFWPYQILNPRITVYRVTVWENTLLIVYKYLNQLSNCQLQPNIIRNSET